MVNPVRPVGPTVSLENSQPESHADRRSGSEDSARLPLPAAVVQFSHAGLARQAATHSDRHVADARRRSIDSRETADAEARRTREAVRHGAMLAARAQANTAPERVADLLAD